MARSKDITGLSLVVDPIPFDTLSNLLLSPKADLGPRDVGTVDMVVLRPDINEREVVPRAAVTRAGGVHGSGWVLRPERGLVDQVCVMSSAAIRAIAGADKANWAPAGDQLFLDLDLSKDNLPLGTRVRIGTFEGVVTKKPHNGCCKFEARYGIDALKAVSTPLSKQRRIRGIYFEVVKDGVVNVGDKVVVLRDESLLGVTRKSRCTIL